MSDQPAPRTLRPRTRLLLTIGVIAIGLVIAGFFVPLESPPGQHAKPAD